MGERARQSALPCNPACRPKTKHSRARVHRVSTPNPLTNPRGKADKLKQHRNKGGSSLLIARKSQSSSTECNSMAGLENQCQNRYYRNDPMKYVREEQQNGAEGEFI
ncbi:hypothetical protein SAICODRAFT_175082 [Saitoella complicata NRRL Y-17804]|uniref:Uncharacterized protein n=1 Tax=Saitoella complicata (strain BCRC 22490 / CBS 7301 / JCM 7358 / NBRC 10748 / NRRL Y-17804) TaxID=698492 RepID=A0A0E9NJU4_SAICN|nr:uncharacterized protein SAICODRAFT_175082 [Saitoella complicata NRRL Y-17804]ODQ50289.1 hypothetical protein SAICODRAFT_175082 [Saitoella complicata NRRL Y-17804]GAO50152.1 hypothetical protein G7K_4286-t1 [Saitoella complicata NRRL Y-17804]